MMKLSLILSKEEEKILIDATYRFKASIPELLHLLIDELAPSSNDDKTFLKKLYQEHKAQILSKDSPEFCLDIWRHGYITGWKLFQIRKKDGLFSKYIEKEVKQDD